MLRKLLARALFSLSFAFFRAAIKVSGKKLRAKGKFRLVKG